MKTDFYGWNVVGAAFTALFVVYSIQFSFGTFVDDIVEDTGWSETRLQLIFAVYIFTYSSLSAVTGALTDRVGPRRVVAVGSVLLTAGYIIWATAPNLWIAFLGLGVVAPLGMSASWVPCNATVVRWFVERRGTALAIATSGTSMANIIAPPVAATLVKAYGWRTALASFALTGGAAMLLSSLWFRRDPESMGQFPDGKDGPPTPLDQTLISSTDGLTAKAASRTRTYWLILGMYALTFVVVFVPFVHSNQFAIDLGIDEITAATVISSIGVGGLAGRLLVGPISDRLGRKRLVVAAFALETLAFFGIAASNGLTLLYPSAVVFGFSYGATVTMLPALVGDYFGREHAGAIVGRIFGTAGSLAAIGPYVAQLLVDSSGSYRFAFVLSGVANGAALVMASRLPASSQSVATT
ncbi:MFS transporter [bacterium]|nr:MFS transporter [bacterium]